MSSGQTGQSGDLVKPSLPMMIILGDDQGVVLDQFKSKFGRALLSDPFKDRTSRHNWYFFKGESTLYWWLSDRNKSLSNQFMIFKNPIVVVIINYRYAEKNPIEKLNDVYKIVCDELLERHPLTRMLIIGYKFQKKLQTHRNFKKEVLSWCLDRRKDLNEESFCDYEEEIIFD